METVGTLLDVVGLHAVALFLQTCDVPAHQTHLTVVYLRLHLPLFERVILRGAGRMADTVDGHMDGAWLSDDEKRLESEAEVVVEQDLIHLHGVWFEVELAVLDLHRVDGLHRGRSGVRHQEDALAFILFSIHRAFDMALPVIGLLTAQ